MGLWLHFLILVSSNNGSLLAVICTTELLILYNCWNQRQYSDTSCTAVRKKRASLRHLRAGSLHSQVTEGVSQDIWFSEVSTGRKTGFDSPAASNNFIFSPMCRERPCVLPLSSCVSLFTGIMQPGREGDNSPRESMSGAVLLAPIRRHVVVKLQLFSCRQGTTVTGALYLPLERLGW